MAFPTPRETIAVRGIDTAAAARLAAELNVSPAIGAILVGRGLATFDECKRFFRPELSHFRDPFLLGDMPRAVERVRRALDGGERITIFGDYDVDGITATALLVRALTALGGNVDYYLPNRLTEGYGLSAEGIDEVAGRGTKLVVTVDCGIGSCAEVARAMEHGCDVIVTDHHEPHGDLPAALAVCNPKVGSYPDPNLAGVGVALKLLQGIVRASGLGDEVWENYLDIVSLGTAADIVPMTGENRIICHRGFGMLAGTKNPGLAALIELQGCGGRPLSTSQVVFLLAPCINAAGRLGDPGRGVKLLLTDDRGEAEFHARELREANVERRALDQHVQDQAVAWVLENCDPDADYGLVAADPEWHIGVIGISASRLVERFYRPTFLFGGAENGRARGSGRSVPGLHLLDVLNECGDLLETYGGHAAAAGAVIRLENVPAFRERFNLAVKSRLSIGDLAPRVIADAETPLTALTPKFHRIIEQMSPFGPGNMRPVFLCSKLRNRYPPRVVGKGHLKLSVSSDGAVMDAIGFNLGERIDELVRAPGYSLAFTLDQNEWNGKVSLQMKVKGMAV